MCGCLIKKNEKCLQTFPIILLKIPSLVTRQTFAKSCYISLQILGFVNRKMAAESPNHQLLIHVYKMPQLIFRWSYILNIYSDCGDPLIPWGSHLQFCVKSLHDYWIDCHEICCTHVTLVGWIRIILIPWCFILLRSFYVVCDWLNNSIPLQQLQDEILLMN